jgi:hypothetical protein
MVPECSKKLAEPNIADPPSAFSSLLLCCTPRSFVSRTHIRYMANIFSRNGWQSQGL